MIVSKICLQEYKPRLENDTCSENYEPDCEHVSKLDSISQKKKKRYSVCRIWYKQFV